MLNHYKWIKDDKNKMQKWSVHRFIIHHLAPPFLKQTAIRNIIKRRHDEKGKFPLESDQSRVRLEWRLNWRAYYYSNMIHSENTHPSTAIRFIYTSPSSTSELRVQTHTEDGDSFALQNPRDPKQHLHCIWAQTCVWEPKSLDMIKIRVFCMIIRHASDEPPCATVYTHYCTQHRTR